MKSKILFEDQYLIVIQKPPGLATQTARVGAMDVVSELKNYLAGTTRQSVPYVGVIHRLDQPVEGILVFAKDKKTADILTRQLADQTMHKQYSAVLCGQPDPKQGELVDNLIKEGQIAKVVTKQMGQYPQAKRAVLQYRTLAQKTCDAIGEHAILSFVDIHIDTGRFHQIRAQMAHAGWPLLADLKYGTAASKDWSKALGVRSVALCAYQLSFIHPVTQKVLHFSITPQGEAFSYFRDCFLALS